ncbi:MAG: O-antigen ligase family protein [Patescibacteria group bacterium]|nr:O-antigen ligase family protein [Patescibacteria group bacterium]
MKSFWGNFLKYGSYILIFILPIIYFGDNISYSYITSKAFVFYAFVEILFSVWIYTMFLDSSFRLSKKNWLYFIPLFVYVGWLTLTGLLGANPMLSFWASLGRNTGLLAIYHCVAFTIIIASLVKRNGINYLYKFLYYFVFGGFILSISIWLGDEGMNVFSFLKDSQGGGLIGNSSLAGTYLLFVLAFAFILLTFPTFSNIKKWWIGIMAGIILFSPIFFNLYGLFTGKGIIGSARGATLGILVMLGVTLFSYLFFAERKVLRIFGITGIVFGFLIFSIGWIQLINPNTWFHQKFDQSASSTRFIFWNAAQKAINKHPWMGYGPENFAIAFQQNFDPKITITNNLNDKHGNETWTDRAHNIYYDTGVSGGYPAILLYLFFIFSILYALYKAKYADKIDSLPAAILVGLLIGYLFQNLFVFDSLHSILALYVLAGIVFVLSDILDKNEYSKILPSLWLKTILAVVLILLCCTSLIFFVYRPLKKAIMYDIVIKMYIDKRPEYYKYLLQGSSIGDQYDTSSMANTIITYYSNNLMSIKADKGLTLYVENELIALSQYLEIITKTNKTDSRLYFSLVNAYLTEISLKDKPFDPVLSKHIFDLLDYNQQLSPNNLEIYWARARTYAWAGDIKNSIKEYQKAIDIDPTIPESHEFLINLAKVIKDQKLYEASMAQARKDIPGFSVTN